MGRPFPNYLNVTHMGLIPVTQIEPSSGLQSLFNGEPSLKGLFCPGLGLICLGNQPEVDKNVCNVSWEVKDQS